MNTKKAYRKLGFSSIESASVVKALNSLLANYQVHYQKLRNYHWNVVGPDFFELHEIFEEEYKAVHEQIDKIAERIRVFGQRPKSTFHEYLERSEIKEPTSAMTGHEMVRDIKSDYEILLSLMIDVTHASASIGDTATDHMITRFVERIEKRHWMLTAYTKTTVRQPAELN